MATLAAMRRLLSIGDLNADITIVAGSDIAPGSDTSGKVRLAAGGSAANVAATAAANGLHARFAGVVGDDLLGGFLVDELAGHGVDVRPIVRQATTSRSIAALIAPNGDRSMVSDLTGETGLRVDDIDPVWFDDVDWLHFTAYSWFSAGGDDVVAALVGTAADRGIDWSIDPSSARMLASTRRIDDALAAFDGASVLFPSGDEAAVLTGVEEPVEAATRLLDIAEIVAVTCGADGVVVARRGRTAFHAPAHDVQVVNTIGAGDAFAAGFIAGRLSGHDDETSAQTALAAAARAVARPTAR